MDGTGGRVEFEEGKLNAKGLQTFPVTDGRHGLFTTFAPTAMVGDITVTPEEVGNLLWEQCHFYPVGTQITYNYIGLDGKGHKDVIENNRGYYEILETICTKPLIAPITFSNNDGSHAVDCLITWDAANMNEPIIMASVNMCHTTTYGSTHVDGLDEAVTRFFRNYMNKIYLTNSKSKNKLQVTAQDVRTGLRAIICGKSISPLYTGQSKEIYSELEMKPYVQNIAYSAVSEWAKNNPNALQNVAKYLKDVCELRTSVDTQRIKIQNNYTASAITGMPAKYCKPNGKLEELFLVEGDSAKGGIINNRNKMTQGIYPLRGKISNVITTSTKDLFMNEEIAGLIKILGYDKYEKPFDPSKFQPAKVVITCDADADGAHITSLLLMFFLKYFPFAVEQGRIYSAIPPLYVVNVGTMASPKMKYFATNLDWVEYLQGLFCKNNTLADVKTNKTLSKNDILRFLCNNIDYQLHIDHVSNIYAIDPLFLEFLLYHYSEPFKEFKKNVEKAYKFVNVRTENGTIIIQGLVGTLYQTVFFNDRLLAACKPVIDLIERDKKYYLFNGQPASIYTIMKVFNNYLPQTFTRAKGLGQMKPELLGESTIIPGYGRTLKQFTVLDIHKELDRITILQSDKGQFIKGLKIRKEDVE